MTPGSAQERHQRDGSAESTSAHTPAQNDAQEPVSVIVPSRRCWQWWARRPHHAHLTGDVPNVKRCPGVTRSS